MAKQIESISPEFEVFIKEQKLFFVATATDKGKINLSPKGMDSFRILESNRVMWLNLTGSGNETATHLQYNNRITVMFCAFEGKPLILRLYGTATVYHSTDHEWKEYISLFPKHAGSRQLIDIKVEMVQTSCGFAVPFMDYKEDRMVLNDWANKKGEQELKIYQKEKNSISLDGFSTGLPA